MEKVKEKSLLMAAPMVQATLERIKWQTRRIIKPQPAGNEVSWGCIAGQGFGFIFGDTVRKCPYGEVGQKFWVRENFRGSKGYDDMPPRDWGNKPVWYCADGEPDDDRWRFLSRKTRPSIFMPRWASRIDLEIIKVRAERLHSITEDDAKAEGARWVDGCGPLGTVIGAPGWRHDVKYGMGYETARESFRWLWCDINGVASWDANPWVWALDFTMTKPAAKYAVETAMLPKRHQPVRNLT